MLDWWSFKIYKYFSLWLELNYWAFKSKFSINSTHSTSRRHAMSHHHAITNQSINISSNKNIERQYQHGRPVQQSRPRDSSRWSMRASLTFASSISLYSCTWDVRWYRIVSMISIESDSCLPRSEEHTSELQSRPHISYAVFCLKKKTILKIPMNTPKLLKWGLRLHW